MKCWMPHPHLVLLRHMGNTGGALRRRSHTFARPVTRHLARSARAPHRIAQSFLLDLVTTLKTVFAARMDPFVDHKFVLTANISSWEQTKDWLFTGLGDGVYLQCLQETRLLDCATVQAKRHAEAAGWTAVMAPALPGGARGPGTGGLAMLARSHLGIVEICPHDQPEQWQMRRWHAASIGGFRRPLVCVNLYAVPSIGPSGTNLQLLSEVGSFLTTLGHGWWIIAGDFNMSPEEIQTTGVIEALGAHLIAAPVPTVYPAFGKPRAIDHFIVGPDVTTLVERKIVTVVDSSPCHTHRPCLLALSTCLCG